MGMYFWMQIIHRSNFVVLAHMSGDEKLIQAYREAEDIHRLTASQVFHVPFDEVQICSEEMPKQLTSESCMASALLA